MISTRIDWVREHCRLLRDIAAEFARTRPFDGLAIGTGIHLEAKTVALLHFADLPEAEIASATGMSMAAVRNQAARAMSSLQAGLG